MGITMKLMDLVEIYNQDNPAERPTWAQKVDYANEKLFDFDFPFYDESKRTDFERKFTRYFLTRELGFETPALFKFQLETVLNIIMPYYNEYFKSQLLEYDPLFNVIMEETFSRTVDTNGETSDKLDGTSTRELTRDTTGQTSNDTTKTGTDKTDGNTSDTKESKKTGTDSTSDDTTKNGTSAKTGTESTEIDKTDSNTNTKTGTESATGTENVTENADHTGTVTTDRSSIDSYSDLPQAMVADVDGGVYLTNRRSITGDETVTNDLTDTLTRETTTSTQTTYDVTVKDDGTETGSNVITFDTTVTDTSTETKTSETTYNTTVSDTQSGTSTSTTTYDTTLSESGNSSENETVNESATDNKTASGTSMEKKIEDYTLSRKGIDGRYSYPDLIQKYRETIINVDLMILNDYYIRSLFIYIA